VHVQFSYWRLTSGAEVDFIVNDMQLAIEAKAAARVSSDHLKGLRELERDHPQVGRRILVCMESAPRRTEDGILILSANEFCRRSALGELY
jgi:predicted AAA+ superfamily ATPase